MNELKVGKNDLEWAVKQGLLDPEQVEPLWRGLATRATAPAASERFQLQHLLWYGGALLVMIAMSWVGLQIWDSFSAPGIIGVALAYGLGFAGLGSLLLKKPGMRVPGGLLVMLAVTMVPLAVFGLEHLLGWWTPVAGAERDMPFLRAFVLELSTIVASLLALRAVRFPFLTAPLAVSAWLATLTFAGWVAGVEGSWQIQAWITAGFGAAMVALSVLVDKHTREDFAAWGYLAGATALWGGATSLAFGASETGLAGYCAFNLGLMLGSVLLSRTVFVVYGGLGVVGYLGYLTFSVFANSVMFPFALTFLGLGTILAGVLYHRHSKQIESAIRSLVPSWLAGALPQPRS